MSEQNYVRIFDTTLRDGEQSPGATLTSSEKMEIAKALSGLGVDIIEAGFPAASPDDLKAVKDIASTVGQKCVEGRPQKTPPTICGLARATKKDIDKAWEAVAPAAHPRIHTFIATSPIHREYKLKMSKEQILARITEMVSYAKSLCDDIEFSPEDAGRTEIDFLHEATRTAIAAGATTINIPDTVGYTTPDEYGRLIKGVTACCDAAGGAIVSVHCHDDLGLATANTLSGISNGARQAEVTINGIGERAGNTPLEETVMAIKTRHKPEELCTGIDSVKLVSTSKLVSKRTGVPVQPNKAIVGANAFAHEAGIHQDGMLKHEETYEIMRPESVGANATMLVLGKHSGKHAFGERLTSLGFNMEGNELIAAFDAFKKLADRKKDITDADLLALAKTEVSSVEDRYQLIDLQVACGTIKMPTATVRIADRTAELSNSSNNSKNKTIKETEHVHASVGVGPIDAIFRAIDNIVDVKCELLEYKVHAVTEGIDALGEVSVRIRSGTQSAKENPQHTQAHARIVHGFGADLDIIVASAKAYLDAVNRLIHLSNS